MRRAAIALISLGLLAGVAPLAWGTASAPRPALRITAFAPVKVTGANFKKSEKVNVVLSLNGAKRAKQTRASLTGRFSVTFSGADATDRCSSDVWARATGRRGSLATAKLPQLQCPPRLGPPSP